MKKKESIATFGDRLKEALKVNNMTQSKLSEISGINTSTISEYIKGKYDPSRSRIFEFSEILKVNPVWLMGFDIPAREETPKKSTRLTTFEKKQLLEKIKKKYKEKNKNVVAICDEYNLKKFDEDINDIKLIEIANDLKISFGKDNYLNKTLNSEIKDWFFNVINSLSDEELEQLKTMVEPVINYIKK